MNQAHATAIAGDCVTNAYADLKPLVTGGSSSMLGQILVSGRDYKTPPEVFAWYEYEKQAEIMRSHIKSQSPNQKEMVTATITRLLLLYVVIVEEEEFYDEINKLEELKGGGQ